MKVRLGTRASPLARWQANWVAENLSQHGVHVELVHVTTAGDRQPHASSPAMGEPGIFTKELQRALLAGEIDIAVHSLKDLPTEAVEGLVLAAVPSRGSVADVLVSREAATLASIPRGAVVGTGSLRRQAQLRHFRPDLRFESIRGNVDTRLRKLAEGQVDALVLAEAGLARLGRNEQPWDLLAPPVFLPAPAQGALGIEARSSDEDLCSTLARLQDDEARAAVEAERCTLAELHGGCLAPVAAWARVLEGDELVLTGAVLSRDGCQRLVAESHGHLSRPHAVAQSVAQELVRRGALELIQQARSHR